jgi:mannose-6-phosphate isomerase-like protein (cupin superfamily)
MTHRNRRDAVPTLAADGSIVRELAGPRSSVLERQGLAEVTLDAGHSTREHFHRESEEVLYILRGKGHIVFSGMAVPRQPGDAIAMEFAVAAGDAVPVRAGEKHKVCNGGAQKLVFLCCSSPAHSDEDTVFTKPIE